MSGTFTFRTLVWLTTASLVVVTLGGCTVTKDLTYDTRLALQNDYFSPNEATRKLEGRLATVHAWSDSSKFNLVELEAENIRVRRDSTLWTDAADGRDWAVSTDHVAMISYRRDHAAGDGFAIGFALSIPTGLAAASLAAWRIEQKHGDKQLGTSSIGLGVGIYIAGLLAAGASILLGTIIGASYDSASSVIVVNGFTPPDKCVPSTEFPCGYRK